MPPFVPPFSPMERSSVRSRDSHPHGLRPHAQGSRPWDVASSFAVALAAVLLLALPGGALQGQAPDLPPGADGAAAHLADSPRHGEWLRFDAGSGDQVDAWVVWPETSEPAPVVVVIHEIFGLTDWIRAVTDQLAAEGWVAIAPDLLSGMGPDGVGSRQLSDDDAVALIRQLDRDTAHRRLRAAADFATGLPGAAPRVATLGFCWGGTASFEMATLHWDELAGAVVFYGTSPEDKEALERIRVPILGLYGEDDARVNVTIDPAARVLEAAGQSFDVHVFPGAGHAFLRQQDARDGANRAASEEAWPRVRSFLDQVRTP